MKSQRHLEVEWLPQLLVEADLESRVWEPGLSSRAKVSELPECHLSGVEAL
jgi:hypothetical protein